MARMFFRARKIWDYMKGSKRHYDEKLVMDLLNKMTSNVIQYNVKSQFKQSKRVEVVEKIFKDIMADGPHDDVPEWVKAKVTTTNRNPAQGNPKTKVLSFEINTGSKQKSVMENLRRKGQFNPFKAQGVR